MPAVNGPTRRFPASRTIYAGFEDAGFTDVENPVRPRRVECPRPKLTHGSSRSFSRFPSCWPCVLAVIQSSSCRSGGKAQNDRT